MKRILLCMGTLIIATSVLSQKQLAAIRPLTIGDTVPNVEFNNILNYHSETARLSDFKGKLVILDFWATWCGSCIASFPKIDSLQKNNPNKIQVVLITKNTAAEVGRLFNRLTANGRSIPVLPCVTSDTVWSGIFPYNMVPHYVWVNADGVVKAITNGWDVTQKNIDSLLQGLVTLPLKKDRLTFDYTKPLLIKNNGAGEEDFLWRSLFIGYQPGLPSIMGVQVDSTKGTGRIYAINISIRQMYEMALQKTFPDNRVFLDLRKSLLYDSDAPISKEDKLKNFRCYELIKPLTDTADIHQLMLNDLRRYLSIKGVVELKKINCLALRGSGKLISPAGNLPFRNVYDKNKKKYVLQNGKVADLVSLLDYYSGKPVFDETGISKSIDLKVDMDMSNIRNVQQALSKFGLELVEIQKEIEVLILSDKG